MKRRSVLGAAALGATAFGASAISATAVCASTLGAGRLRTAAALAVAADAVAAEAAAADAVAADAAGPAAPADAAAFLRLAEATDTLRRTAGIPGLALAVRRAVPGAGGRVMTQCFGVTDVDAPQAVTPATLFNIASVSKPISAVVALRLVEQGRLDLDQPLARTPGFADFCASASQGGGIFFADFQCASTKDDATPLTLRHLLAMQANGPPGSRFFYNPPAYSWASRPIAQAGGQPFSDLVVAQVFQPAGMHGAARIHRSRPLPPALQALLAAPHRIDAQGHAVRAADPPPQGDGAAGGVVASALDLARFDAALDDGRLLSPASKQQMWAASAGMPYGLGWFVRHTGGAPADPVVWHTGLWEDAYSALYLKLPRRGLTLILLANSDGLRWPQRLDEAAIERSPFALAFFQAFGVVPPAP